MTTSELPAPTTEPARCAESWLALTALLAGAFLGTLDTTVVNIALRTIQEYFGADITQVQLVGSGYIMAFAATLVLGGKIGDKVGRRSVFRCGVLLFLLLSVACASAASLPALIVLRLAQGLSAALMVPQVLAIIRASFPQKSRIATSLYGATLGLASISGMIVGGLLAGAAGWRSIFVINIPICLAILLGTRRGLLPESRGTVRGFDILGPVLLVLAMMTILLPVSFPQLGAHGVLVGWTIGFVVLAAAFWAYEKSLERRKGDTALVPPAMFARRTVGIGLLILGVYFVGTAGFNVVLAFQFQEGFHLSQFAAGLAISTLGMGFALGSAVAHRAEARLGIKVIVIGCFLMVVTRVLLVWAQAAPWAIALVLTSVLTGITGAAQGIVVPPLISLVLRSVARRFSGVASGVLLTVCNCAIAIGQAVFLALYSARGVTEGASSSFVPTIWVMAGLAGLAVLMSASALRLFHRDQGVAHED